MSKPTSQSAWAELQQHRKDIAGVRLSDLLSDEKRFAEFSIIANGILLDYSKNLVDRRTIKLLLDLAEQSQLPDSIRRLFSGVTVNNTEKRPAMHMALRATDASVGGEEAENIQRLVDRELEKMDRFVGALHGGRLLGCTGKPINKVVNIGIGGSDLGPVMAVEALKGFRVDGIEIAFVSSIDGTHLKDVFDASDPEQTLFVVCSKSFTTLETLKNAEQARALMHSKLNAPDMESKHFAAVSVNRSATRAFGIDDANVFDMWDWVGGRYSVCSAVGLALACAVGMDNFKGMLAGCAAMDTHFREAPLGDNLPVMLGLLAVWYNNFHGAQSHAILPYDNRLHRFPAYLQQLQMESNGKRVDRSGKALEVDSGQIIWGEPGPNAQHSFYQLLHQGTRLVPADFLVPLQGSGFPEQHQLALAACFAQSRALALGQPLDQVLRQLGPTADEEQKSLAAHRVHPGNRPSNTIVFPRVDPFYLGQLIALYEHKVFVESVIWDINPFDQFGVELGKRLASELEPVIRGAEPQQELDVSTLGLCDFLRKNAG